MKYFLAVHLCIVCCLFASSAGSTGITDSYLQGTSSLRECKIVKNGILEENYFDQTNEGKVPRINSYQRITTQDDLSYYDNNDTGTGAHMSICSAYPFATQHQSYEYKRSQLLLAKVVDAPEPSVSALFGAAVIGLVGLVRRRSLV